MAQADLNVANQSGSAFRADLNNQLLALGTLMSGASEPSTTYAYMLWADTANGLLKQRNAANSAWITVRNLDGTYARGTAGSPSVPFDGGTGIYSPGEDQVAIATGGTGRLFVDASGRILAGVSTALTNAYSIGTALAPAVQLEGNTGNAAALSITRHASAASNLLLQRGVIGTPVVDADAVGQINFNGFDGTNYVNAALIRAAVEGTPGSGSMPGRLSFQTTPSGSTTPVERLRLDSTGQIEAASLGTAAAPVYTFVGDPNTGIYSPGADQVAVSTGGTERARIDSSGRLLVGTSTARSVFSAGAGSPRIQQEAASFSTAGLSLFSTSDTAAESNYLAFGRARGGAIGSTTIVNSGDTLGFISFCGSDGAATNHQAARIEAYVDGTPGANDMPGRIVLSTTSDGASSPTERMRITNSGLVLVGTTTAYDTGLTLGGGEYFARATSSRSLTLRRDTTDGSIAEFRRDATAVGTISVTTTATAYNTSSDYRLKENVAPLTGATDRLNQLQVHRFNFIADPGKTVDGFIAHEAQAVVPECVTGTKDEVDADGNPIYQGIDQSKLVPLLTAALQEALAEIESLKARVTALEA